ncbi:MAG: radical SAM protein, partial [Thermodesulfobacteriota bacterium]
GKRSGLKYVYIGNVHGHAGGDTYCPGCGKAVIKRAGYFNLQDYMIRDGCCAHCHAPIDGVGM